MLSKYFLLKNLLIYKVNLKYTKINDNKVTVWFQNIKNTLNCRYTVIYANNYKQNCINLQTLNIKNSFECQNICSTQKYDLNLHFQNVYISVLHNNKKIAFLIKYSKF